MVLILTYIVIFSGVVLILMMVMSLFAGLDFDLELDADVDGGFGVVKSVLTFLSISSMIIRVVVLSEMNIWIGVFVAILAGALAIWLMSYLFKLLRRNEENVNWTMDDALFQKGTVYLRVPGEGEGIVHVLVNGVNRELKAKSNDGNDIPTGESIIVMHAEEHCVFVEPIKE